MPKTSTPALCFAVLLLSTACSPTTEDTTTPLTSAEVQPVAERYADLIAANYGDAYDDAVALQQAIDDFVSAPSEAGLEAARAAWLVARESYGTTEAFRFYGGPIDNPDYGPEGQLNAWPMDEAYVDYVEGMPDAGIVNDPANYPTIDTALLSDVNEQGGETNIASGYHAIEFLLWGQDLSADGPGARPWTDFDQSGAGTAANQDRRGIYLMAAAELLVSDLASLVDAWDAAASNNYRSAFVAATPDDIVRRMMLGIGSLSGAELAGERIEVALDTRDQEDEHSCFSDNTHRDIVNNAVGIQNVYLGSYASDEGPSLYDLVASRDAELADRLRDEIQASVDAANMIPAPFDRAIVDQRETVEAVVDALRVQTDTIAEVAALFDITLALE